MKKLLGVVTAMLWLSQVVPIAASAQVVAENVVVVKDFRFTPDYLEIEAGETVTWDVEEDNHTITSDATDTLAKGELFDYAVDNGDLITQEFPVEGTFGYHCRIHGDMRGTIQVGEKPEICSDCPAQVLVVPSAEFPTLATAVTSAPPKSLIELRPGTYDIRKTIELETPGVVIQGTNDDGTPADPRAVVLRGRNGTAIGIVISGSGAADSDHEIGVKNLTLTGFLDTGLHIAGGERFIVENVHAIDNVEHGMRATDAHGGRITRSYTSGHRVAGIAIHDCDRCDIVVEEVASENNFAGLLGENADNVTVRWSTFRGNASGVVLRSVATRGVGYEGGSHVELPLQQGAHIYGNELHNNDNIDAPYRSVFRLTEAMELPVGAGIWIQSGLHDTIEDNIVTGSYYGIVVTASTGPSYDGRVVGNTLSDNHVDVGWDGIGARLCFANHAVDDQAKPTAVTSEPATLEMLYPCDGSPRVGVPYPKVTADLAAYAIRNHYCKEIDGRTCT